MENKEGEWKMCNKKIDVCEEFREDGTCIHSECMAAGGMS